MVPPGTPVAVERISPALVVVFQIVAQPVNQVVGILITNDLPPVLKNASRYSPPSARRATDPKDAS
jgi:hypothetical protein